MNDINIQDDFFEKVNKQLEKNKNYNENILYGDLYMKYYSVLLHELQHAYDDFISNGKSFSTKQQKEYTKTQKDFSENHTQELSHIKHKQYLALPHEINARFAQAVKRIKFYNLDGMKYVKKSFKIVLDDFKSYFDGYVDMTEDIKKRLTQRLYQMWISDYDKK